MAFSLLKAIPGISIFYKNGLAGQPTWFVFRKDGMKSWPLHDEALPWLVAQGWQIMVESDYIVNQTLMTENKMSLTPTLEEH